MKSKVLSEDLKNLVQNSDRQTFTVADFVTTAGDRAFGLVLLLLALPSALPIPATGISTPLGIGIFFIGLQMCAGRELLWLPEKVLKIKINRGLARSLVSGLTWVLDRIEKIVRPRMHWMGTRWGSFLVGAQVALLSLVMQIPIPLTNTLPAAVIFCMAICQTEEDGFLGVFTSVLGFLVTIGYIVGFTAIVFYGFQGFDEVILWIKSYLR